MNVENISITVQEKGADTAAKHLSSLADALSKLESAASSMSSLQNLVALDRAIIGLTMNKNPASTISSLANGIKTLSDALNKFDVSKLSLIGQIRGAMASFEGFSGSTTGIANGIKTLASTLKTITDDDIARIKKIADAMSGMNGFHGSTSGIAKGIESLSVTLASITDDDISKLDKIASALSKISTNANGLSSGASRLGSAFKSMSSHGHSVNSALKSMSSHGHKASSSMRSLGDSAKHSAGMLGKLWSSIKRIAFYRLLRTLIKNITKDFQEGLKNAYTFSKGIAGSLAQAMDGMSAQYSQMKNQMGAAFGELIQTIMPIIEAIISAITRLMSALSALFAALGGRMKFLSAGENEAAGWDKATGSAKQYKNTILGFDEINRLNDENGGGGGGGGADPGVWELKDLPDWAQKIKDMMDRLKELFSLGEFEQAGRELARWLNSIFPDDKWWHDKGVWLGKKLNNVIDFAFGFLDEADFEKYGGGLGSFFSGLIETVNWERVGRVISLGITDAIDFAIGFVKKTNTLAIGQAISKLIIGFFNQSNKWLQKTNFKALGLTLSYKILQLLEGLDTAGIAQELSDFLINTFNAGTDFLSGIKWLEIADYVTQKIHDFLTNVDWAGVASSASTFLSEAISGVADFLGEVDWAQLTDDAFSAFEEFIGGIEWDKLGEAAWKLFSNAFTAAGKVLRVVFDHLGIDVEGTVSAEEISSALEKIALPIGGAILGWKTAGLGGSAIGLTLGIVLSFAFQKYIEEAEGEIDYQDLLQKIVGVALPIAGAIKGWKIGGLGGAAIGLSLGILIKLIFENALEAEGGLTWDTLAQAVSDSGILPIAGAILGWKLFGLQGAAIGLALGVALSFTIKDLAGVDGQIDQYKILDAICKNVLPAALGAIVGGAIGGPLGMVIGMTVGVAITFAVQSETWQKGWNYVGGAQKYMNAELYGITGYASGGMPEMGSLFVAGEAGAEIVSNLGNGRTGVTNVEQMEAAVANGNANVVNAVYAMANMIVKAVNEIDPDITLDGESLADKMYSYNQSAQRRHGAAMVT